MFHPSHFEADISEKKRVSNIDIQIGARLRLLREQRGVSRGTLARTLNISQQQVQKYESGQNRISAGLLPKLANQLGVPISYLFDNLPERKPEVAANGSTPKAGGDRLAAVLGLTIQCLAFIRMFMAIKRSESACVGGSAGEIAGRR